jgi:pimeloyl-ACP methyl ester carboxylesterase
MGMTATSSATREYVAAPNKLVTAANGVAHAYREVGEGTPALVLLQHFRGNLDNWDPALVDALARDRRVVTFDNTGNEDLEPTGGGISDCRFRDKTTPRCRGA